MKRQTKRILTLALTLIFCLGLLPATASAADSDFVIEDGVLVEYTGPGGNVTIPDGVTEIGWGAFEDCTSLTSITIPTSVTEIGWYAFAGCTGLTSIVIPNSVTLICFHAFESCTGLISVTIPNSIIYSMISIGGAFGGCTSLTNFVVSEDHPSFSVQDGVLFNKDRTSLLQCPEGKSGAYAIPNGVTEIGRNAFKNCARLTSVTIPTSVTEIGWYAFQGCTGLTNITIPNSVTTIDEFTFDGCTSLTSVVIPTSVTKIERYAFQNCTSLVSITIPGNVTSFGETVFEGCTGLTNVTILDGVTEIGKLQFNGCTSLTNIAIPGSVLDIGTGAFWGCTNLTIHGVAGSAAEAFCELWGFPFVADYAAAVSKASIAGTAYTSTQAVNVDGQAMEFQCYALKDGNGNMSNYIKLRDLAIILNGTKAQFQVGWDGNVTITTGQRYIPNGSELSTPFSGNRPYKNSTEATKVNGRAAQLAAFILNDDAGGGYTYYQLRDLGKALGFNVGWSAQRGMFLETDKPYDPSN